VKIGPVLAGLFDQIILNMPICAEFFAHLLQKFRFLPSYFPGLLEQTSPTFTRCKDIITAIGMHSHGNIGIRCGTPEHRVNAVDLNVCKLPSQLTGYYSKVPRVIAKIMLT